MNSIVTNHAIAILAEPTIQPLHDRILVRRLETSARSGVLWIPDTAQDNSKRAIVLALGNEVRGLSVGDEVLLPGIAAKYPDWEQSDMMMVQEGDVGGIFSN